MAIPAPGTLAASIRRVAVASISCEEIVEPSRRFTLETFEDCVAANAVMAAMASSAARATVLTFKTEVFMAFRIDGRKNPFVTAARWFFCPGTGSRYGLCAKLFR
jgi:hypothetical protein